MLLCEIHSIYIPCNIPKFIQMDPFCQAINFKYTPHYLPYMHDIDILDIWSTDCGTEANPLLT